MKRLILAALMAAAPAQCQVTDAGREQVTRLVQLKYAEPDTLRNLIEAFGVEVRFDSRNKALTVSGMQVRVDAAIAAINKLDSRPKNVELTAFFVVGSDRPNLEGGSVPPEIRDVIAQLKTVFTFKDYRMLDTLTIRTRAGGSSAETTGILGGVPPRLTNFAIRNASVSEDGQTIRIDRMHAGLRIPMARNPSPAALKNPGEPAPPRLDYMNTGLDQDIDVKEGQKIVVGRSSLEGPEKALFIILGAKVLP